MPLVSTLSLLSDCKWLIIVYHSKVTGTVNWQFLIPDSSIVNVLFVIDPARVVQPIYNIAPEIAPEIATFVQDNLGMTVQLGKV